MGRLKDKLLRLGVGRRKENSSQASSSNSIPPAILTSNELISAQNPAGPASRETPRETPSSARNETDLAEFYQRDPLANKAATATDESGDENSNENGERLNLWLEARKELKEDERRELDKYFKLQSSFSINEISTQIKNVKSDCEAARWGYVTKDGKKIIYRDIFDKIIAWAVAFKDIGTAAAAFDPTQHAQLVWGAVSVIISVCSWKRACTKLFLWSWLMETSRQLLETRRRATLLLKSSLCPGS